MKEPDLKALIDYRLGEAIEKRKRRTSPSSGR